MNTVKPPTSLQWKQDKLSSYSSCRSSLQRKGWLNPKIRARSRNLTSFITNKFNIARRVNV